MRARKAPLAAQPNGAWAAYPCVARIAIGFALLCGIAWLWVGTHAPEAGESWCLRWLRKALEHPVRGAAAAGLAAWALAPGVGRGPRHSPGTGDPSGGE